MTEEKIRQLAESRHLTLRRSSGTDSGVPGYGIYWLLDAHSGFLVYPDRWGATLPEIEQWLVRGHTGNR